MNVYLTPSAFNDLKAIKAYLAARNELACARIMGAIDATLSYLESFPLFGAAGRVDGTRERTVPGTPYVIVYEIFSDTSLYVLRVRHTSMIWPPDQTP